MRATATGERLRIRDLPWAWGVPTDMPDGVCEDSVGVRVAVRAVACAAGPEVIYLWLCQLRRAPYSYDWIDNFGRRSPRIPDPAMTQLAVGQRVMTIFTLTSFVPGRSLTVSMNPGWPTWVFGSLDVRYDITPGQGASVLAARLRMPLPPGPLGSLRRGALAWGDLLMMRKQLKTLARLAEETTAGRHGVVGHGGGL